MLSQHLQQFQLDVFSSKTWDAAGLGDHPRLLPPVVVVDLLRDLPETTEFVMVERELAYRWVLVPLPSPHCHCVEP